MAKNKLKILMAHAEETAVGFYRIVQPAVAIAKTGLAEVRRLPFNPGSGKPQAHDIEFYEQLGTWADVFVFQRVDNPKSLALIMAMKERFKKPVIMDIDDYVHQVKSDNLAYKDYQPGSPTQYYAERMMGMADGMMVTTPWLKKLYQGHCKNIKILPNCMDLERTGKYKKRQYKDIRIGYAAASGHQRDLAIAKNAIMAILEENKNVTFHIFGAKHEELSHPRIKRHSWVSFDRYYRKLASLGLDIGIAPLEDNYYNRAKSNLRWLEYSAYKIPTIASNVSPFARTIKHAETGYLAKEPMDWYKYLSYLVKNEKLRDEIGSEAYNAVEERFNIKEKAKQYYKYLDGINKKYKHQKAKK